MFGAIWNSFGTHLVVLRIALWSRNEYTVYSVREGRHKAWHDIK